ncbi:MAG TPA: DUF3108 domain-containing protein [Pyrinomonadaceae bacterium]|nr:DUF3108 domain-containing protein [Pyrinomonadaceae bacterium]
MKLQKVWMRVFVLVVACACALVVAPRVAAFVETKEQPRSSVSAPASLPFEPAEQLVYEAEFSKLLLRGIKIAEFKFTAGRTDAAHTGPTKTAPHLFVGDIESKGWFRKLFGINFHFRIESTVEPETFAVLRTKKLDEQGKRVRTSEALFDRAADRVAWKEIDPNDPRREPRIVNNPLGGAMHDVLSAIYFLRTQTLTPGKTFNLVLSDSGEIYHVPAKVVAEKKLMKTPVGKVSVVRVDVELFGEHRPVEGKGEMSMWVTNDARRLPVRAKLSSDLGTLVISLKSVQSK